jgi:hypothetical protein
LTNGRRDILKRYRMKNKTDRMKAKEKKLEFKGK